MKTSRWNVLTVSSITHSYWGQTVTTILRYFRHLLAILATTIKNVVTTVLIFILLYVAAFIIGMGFSDGSVTSKYLAQPQQSNMVPRWDQLDSDYQEPGKKYTI